MIKAIEKIVEALVANGEYSILDCWRCIQEDIMGIHALIQEGKEEEAWWWFEGLFDLPKSYFDELVKGVG
jgi:hypothetical protein